MSKKNRKQTKVIGLVITFLTAIGVCFLIAFFFSGSRFNSAKEIPLSQPQGVVSSPTPSPQALAIALDRSIGTNLSGIVEWSSQIPFLDAFKSSKPWITQAERTWDTQEEKKLDLDANGWVKSLPQLGDSANYTSVGTLMFREIGGMYPPGKYIVLYQGEGTMEYGFDAIKDENASRPGKDVIDVTPSNKGIWLKISATDPNKTGNYIRNIHVVRSQDEKSYQSKIFNPEFIDRIKDFRTLRFMDWMATNDRHQQQKEWRDRPTLQSARYSDRGVPVEIMVELANRVKSDPWFSLHHQVSDEYVTNFARYVKENLDPDRKVYVEYSNEVWNGVFVQFQWVTEQAKLLWPGSNKDDNTKRINFFSKRTTEIAQIWDRVFGEDKARVIGVMAAQAANAWIAQQELSYNWTKQPLSHAEYGIDAIAIAPYFGGYLGNPENEAQVSVWASNIEDGSDRIFEELTKGGRLIKSSEGGAVQQSYDWIQAHIELAKQENLQVVAYESGQHLAGVGPVANDEAITKLFIAVNRDPRMGTIYREYIQKWFDLGGGLLVNFTDIGLPSRWGSWGVLESVESDNSPKYDAMIEAIDRLKVGKS
jgi:hypothetical protein